MYHEGKLISAALLIVFGTTKSLPIFLVVILVIGFLGGGYEKNGGMTVIGFIFEVGAGVGVMMTGFFGNIITMYIFDIIVLIIGLVFMIASNDKFIGKR